MRRDKRRRIAPTGRTPARRFVIYPDGEWPYVVEVLVSRTRAHMMALMEAVDDEKRDPEVNGLCRTWHYKTGFRRNKGAVVAGLKIARIYLNVTDVRRRPSEIPTHECGHAAMGWARFRQANILTMPGEEVMCHALGRLVAQMNHHLFALKVFES